MNNYKEFLELTQVNAPGSVTEPAERAANAPGPEAEPLGDELPPDYDSLPEPERRRIQSAILGRQAAYLGIDKTLSQARAGVVMPYRPPVFTCSEAVRKCISPGPLPPPPPVSQIEQDRAAFAQIAREDAAKNARSKGLEGGKFRHDVIAECILDWLGREDPPGLVMLNDLLHRYDAAKGIYVPAERFIPGLVDDWIPGATEKQRLEVLRKLLISHAVPLLGAGSALGEDSGRPRIGLTPAEERRKKYLVPFANGVLDLLTGELAPDFAAFWRHGFVRRIPFDWDPEAYDAATDKALDAYARTDPAVRLKIAELAGFCLYGSNDLKTAFVIYGERNTGKSTLLDLLAFALGGSGNVDNTDIFTLCRRPFALANIYGKFATFTSELSARFMADSGSLKGIISGDSFTVDRKFRSAFTFSPAAKVIIATNTVPRFEDDGGGVASRLQFIHLDNPFPVSDYGGRLRTEAAARYLLRLGAEAFRERLRRGSWTVTRAEARLTDELRHNADPNLPFFEDLAADPAWLVDSVKTSAALYTEYQKWALNTGLPPARKLPQRAVSLRACEVCGLVLGEQERGPDGERIRRFRRP